MNKITSIKKSEIAATTDAAGHSDRRLVIGHSRTHLDLFSGIGGFALAAQWLGIKTSAFCEIEPHAQGVLRKHWPDVPIYTDVTKLCRRCYDCEPENEEGECFCPRCNAEFGECDCIGTDQYLDEHGQPWLLTAGFPCQDVSNAGTTHAGGLTGLDGARSGLWFEAYRIVRELSPAVVLLENVPALRTRGADRVCDDLESLGYAVWPFVVGAWSVGGQIKRDRAWLLAIPRSECERLERNECQELAQPNYWRHNANAARPDWGRASSRLRGAPDGIPGWVGQLKCYGNAIVPEVASCFIEWAIDHVKVE